MNYGKTIIGMLAIVVLGIGLLPAQVFSASSTDDPTSWEKFQQCKVDCNESYGGIDVIPPAVRNGGALGWSNCVLKCEKNYWKAVDKELSDLSK